jgi:hypothetical protein
MLHTLADLTDCSIGATDGPIGRVVDLYFDDEAWVIRYFVADSGTWLSGRQVLIPAVTVRTPNWPERLLPVSISRQQVKDSPNIDTDKPVTRQHEETYLGHYDYPCYWNGTGSDAAVSIDDDRHLRSCKALVSYHVHATDGDVGHIQGFLIDDENWSIRYTIVRTSGWWPGHLVLIAPEWISVVAWEGFAVSVDLSREAVKGSPPYTSASQLDREQGLEMHRHFGRRSF